MTIISGVLSFLFSLLPTLSEYFFKYDSKVLKYEKKKADSWFLNIRVMNRINSILPELMNIQNKVEIKELSEQRKSYSIRIITTVLRNRVFELMRFSELNEEIKILQEQAIKEKRHIFAFDLISKEKELKEIFSKLRYKERKTKSSTKIKPLVLSKDVSRKRLAVLNFRQILRNYLFVLFDNEFNNNLSLNLPHNLCPLYNEKRDVLILKNERIKSNQNINIIKTKIPGVFMEFKKENLYMKNKDEIHAELQQFLGDQKEVKRDDLRKLPY